MKRIVAALALLAATALVAPAPVGSAADKERYCSTLVDTEGARACLLMGCSWEECRLGVFKAQKPLKPSPKPESGLTAYPKPNFFQFHGPWVKTPADHLRNSR